MMSYLKGFLIKLQLLHQRISRKLIQSSHAGLHLKLASIQESTQTARPIPLDFKIQWQSKQWINSMPRCFLGKCWNYYIMWLLLRSFSGGQCNMKWGGGQNKQNAIPLKSVKLLLRTSERPLMFFCRADKLKEIIAQSKVGFQVYTPQTEYWRTFATFL